MTDTPQSPHWADAIVERVRAWQTQHPDLQLHVDDMKTPSGRVHTGALRGVMIHDIVAKAAAAKLASNGPVVSTYVFNDMDPMDGLPSYLSESIYQKHMGKPMFTIPAPPLAESGLDLSSASPEELAELQAASTFGELYALDFIHAFRRLGCDQQIVWSHELYQSGAMDEAIRTALDSVTKIKSIYKEVADYQLPARWYPFQVICQKCGKLGTTTVTDWNGSEVTYECQPNKVTWATGCGHEGSTSPFGGTGKLLWKVDWPAHWKTLGVTVEGAGKDHTSAGGSRDMANAFCTQIFDITPPFDIPYEWILVRGAKMSSSKGVGTSARQFITLFPPVVGRFLFTSRDCNQVIDFDPTSMSIPDLFDEFDQAARVFWGETAGDLRQARAYELAQMAAPPEVHFLPRFRDIATWMQYPELDVTTQCKAAKGGPLTPLELTVLQERLTYAKSWVEQFAPEEMRFTPPEEMPATASALSADQLAFARDMLTQSLTATDPAQLQQDIFIAAKESVGTRAGFQAIYQVVLGKTAGPRAGWLLHSLNPDLRQARLSQLALLMDQQQDVASAELGDLPLLSDSEILRIQPEVKAAYPSINLGIAIIRGVHIAAQSPELEQEKSQVLADLGTLDAQKLGEHPELASYRQLYKQMGIDWHSRRPSPEALLRRLAQGKELYTVNTCVDAYNLVVMKHRVSIGAFDLLAVSLPTELRISDGSESISLLGASEPTALKPGELYYADQVGPYNLDFNYRDSLRTAVTLETTDLLLNVDGVHDISRQQVEQSLQEAIALIQKYCGGTVELAGIVSAQK